MKNGDPSLGEFHLRPHQKEAVAAVVRGLSDVAGGDVRGTVVMATGTGKTITAAVAAHRLVPRGRCGVLVPTLDLLAQTAEAWRRAGHRGRMIAVCSLGDDPLLEALGVRCTTDPGLLARWVAGAGSVVVLATYASLVPQSARQDGAGNGEEGVGGPQESARARRGVLERAVRGEGFTGPSLPAFDLLVVDEAHRTSGDLGKSWAAALDQGRVPAVRRLFMTATPRLWETPPVSGGEGRLVASMDDQRLYGPVLFELELMEAVERGLLARWEIDVLEITDPQAPAPEAGAEAQLDRWGVAAGVELVSRLMRELGLVPCLPRSKRFTLTQAAAGPVPDLVGRDFTADAPGEKLVGDITYIASGEGWLYLATVIDCCTKEVIGYAMDDHCQTPSRSSTTTSAAGRVRGRC
ncbi:DEAD/DEAH box helicase family protein [Streptomyces sp. GSL17-111]|uniref:DEAD/DEAH box helicase family protein n=1 Tax=Streptomyces sp. GSL17-111 TaxID=3121596 RepID=UPI004040AFCB